MSTPSEKHERQDRVLAEILELALDLARSSHARALAAEDASEAADHGLTFQRATRSVRQTLALEAKFERDRKTAERADDDVAKRAKASHVARRKAQVRLAVERCVWSEADGSEAENLVADLDDILELDALAGAFAGDDAIETHVARVCAELGVDTPDSRGPSGRSAFGLFADFGGCGDRAAGQRPAALAKLRLSCDRSL
jgi:hypothetical protein